MVGGRAAIKPPKFRAVTLGTLADADEYDLDEDSTLESLRWHATDVGDRSLRGVTFVACELDNVSLHDADLTAASIGETRLTRLNAPVLKAPDASWVGAELSASRIGAWEGYGSHLRATHVVDCKITYANLRGSTLTDVLFTGCVFDELDLMDVRGKRVRFVDCSVGVLTAHHTAIEHLDLRGVSLGAVSGMDGLRGALMSEDQVAMLAPQFAAHLGIYVE